MEGVSFFPVRELKEQKNTNNIRNSCSHAFKENHVYWDKTPGPYFFLNCLIF